jgi:glycerol-3-phosphate dehydrogenase
LGREKVRFVYSGFRPLLSPEDADLDSAAVTRDDHIEVSTSDLISVVGGKLTTARIMAIRVLDRVIEKIGGTNAWS